MLPVSTNKPRSSQFTTLRRSSLAHLSARIATLETERTTTRETLDNFRRELMSLGKNLDRAKVGRVRIGRSYARADFLGPLGLGSRYGRPPRDLRDPSTRETRGEKPRPARLFKRHVHAKGRGLDAHPRLLFRCKYCPGRSVLLLEMARLETASRSSPWRTEIQP